MQYAKLKTSAEAGGKLRFLRQRTGLTPNLLCRLAIMLSLEEGPVGPTAVPDEGGLEFNAYTLTGELTGLYLALVRFVEGEATPLNPEEVLVRLRAHIHRGVATLAVRARSPAEIARLCAAAA